MTSPILLNPDGNRDPSFQVSSGDSLVGMVLQGPADGPLITGFGYGLAILRAEFPLRIVSSTRDAGGERRLTANALAGRTYTLQSSENLADWSDLGVQIAATNRTEFSDSTAPSANRFYRLKQD